MADEIESVENVFNTMEFEEELDPHSEEYFQRALNFTGEDLTLCEASVQTCTSLKFATKEEEEKYAHTSDDIYHHRKLDYRRRVCDAYFTTMRVMQQRKTKFSYINVTIKKNHKIFIKTNK
jgi:hypothetical protein